MSDELEMRLRAAAGALEPPAFDAEAFADSAAAAGVADLSYAELESPLGSLLVAVTPRGLARIAYLGSEDRERVLGELAERLSPRLLAAPRRVDDVRRQLERYFEGRLREFDVELDWALVPPFGRRVLRRTASIPYGQTSSYGAIAREIGSPRAARATGNALGANPIPIVVPCHRVLRSGGELGGYAGGLERKLRLLELERRGAAG